MISIFICENNESYLDFVAGCVKEYIIKFNLGVDVELKLCVKRPDEILKFVEENKVNGLYFLDIELDNEKNGVLLAKAIKQNDPKAFIVFITSHEKYMQATLNQHIEPLDYIVKADDGVVNKAIASCIKSAQQRYIDRSKDWSYSFKNQNSRITTCEYKKILFFEKDGTTTSQRIILHAKNRQYKFYGTLSKVFEKLPNNTFLRCHKSYIVNLESLTSSCREQLAQGQKYMVMPDGAKCYVSSDSSKVILKLLNATMGVKNAFNQCLPPSVQ